MCHAPIVLEDNRRVYLVDSPAARLFLSLCSACLSSTLLFQAMLHEKIKIEGLRTYLFTYAPCYDSLSLDQVCDMFGMPKSTAHSIISKMMISGELHGSWDQPTETVVLQKVEPTRLEVLALQFADKVGGGGKRVLGRG